MSPLTVLSEELVLASASPRRAEILRAVGWPFEVLPADVDEARGAGEDAVTYVTRLAKEKALVAAGRVGSGRLVLAADTTVVIDGEILEKPHDAEDARRMLRLLSGKWHEVLTGVALLRVGAENQCVVDHEVTRVRFASMSEAEIDWYVASGEALGKAGAYGVQGRAALFIEEIEGDYFNIVGLPIRLVYALWQRIAV